MNISSTHAKSALPGHVQFFDSPCESEETLDDQALAHESRLWNEAFAVALNAPDIRQDRIDAIRASIADGTYEIDAKSIAESLLRENPALFDEIPD